MGSGRWMVDDGRWTVDYGPFHCHAINHFVTSRIKHTPYETFLLVIFTIASRNQSLHGFLVSKSRFHPPGVAKGFIKGEALRLLRTNSSHLSFEENMSNFKTCLQNRGYPARIVEKHLSEIKFSDREMPLACKE